MLAFGVGSAPLRGEATGRDPDPGLHEKPFWMVFPSDLNVGSSAPIKGPWIDGRGWTDQTRHAHARLETSARLADHLSRYASGPRGSTPRERVRRRRGPCTFCYIMR